MSTEASNILSAAMSLSEDDRALIARELLHSICPPGVLSEDNPSFNAEIDRRIEAYDRGETTASNWEEVDERMRQAIKERKFK